MAENLAPNVVVRVMREIRSLVVTPPVGIKISLNEDNVTVIGAEIEGPVGTPFEGGAFHCKLVLGHDFPAAPPKGVMITKIFHPNISKTGEICVNTLKKDWSPNLGIQHVLSVIRCLLIYPNPESALNEEAGRLLLEGYEQFAARARLMTQIHAKPKEAAKDCDQPCLSPVKKKPALDPEEQAKKVKAADKTLEKKKSLRRL